MNRFVVTCLLMFGLGLKAQATSYWYDYEVIDPYPSISYSGYVGISPYLSFYWDAPTVEYRRPYWKRYPRAYYKNPKRYKKYAQWERRDRKRYKRYKKYKKYRKKLRQKRKRRWE